ncbi:hypothetical protein Agub_g8952 [Astrephomene gubernaculifera]|uniref:Lon N-terminal domain-containing protein n=1 Tax=Astrephomene gubernaculifera TaxID=47775 RepID=A0AAD3DSI6_9CHLO|nr:hypothetical protein Agub_g8952 [Astrephomene gubernaculifera]
MSLSGVQMGLHSRPAYPATRSIGLVHRQVVGTTARRVSTRSSAIDASIFPVSLFPSHKVLLPTATGVLHVTEPHLIQMFSDLAAKTGTAITDYESDSNNSNNQDALYEDNSSTSSSNSSGNSSSSSGSSSTNSVMRFGHILSPAVAPPALMEDAVGGMPRVGVLSVVRRLRRSNDDASLVVEYEGLRRIRLVSVWQQQPYMVAAASYLADRVGGGEEQRLLDGLEWELYGLLQEVRRLSRQLRSPGEAPAELPECIPRYAPPAPAAPRSAPSLAQHLQAAGHPAGNAISMWQRHGSVYGNSKGADAAVQDPYSFMSERLGKHTRQELFSFAAAGMLELGPLESLALLNCTDRAARLQWVAAAVEPFLETQRARAAVARALGGGTGGAAGGGEEKK